LSDWKDLSTEQLAPNEPVVIQSQFEIESVPKDTFLDMSSWHKGIVFINGFNLGRYFKAGPTQTLYVPAPLLRTGVNTVNKPNHT